MYELGTLSFGQYQLVLNTLNLSIALLGGFTLVFALLSTSVGTVYRLSLALMAAVVGMAAYHYLRIYENWGAAFTLQEGAFTPNGTPFNYAYRYADWIGTVPLILAATVLVLDLGRKKTSSLVTRMIFAALLMIGLGYFGEIERTDMTLRAIWGAAGTLPFLYIVYLLWSEMSGALEFESNRVRRLFGNMRLLLLASWGFYPIVYMFPMLGLTGSTAEVAVQVGNSVADIVAKAGMGLLIYAIAREKSEEELESEVNEVDVFGQPGIQPEGVAVSYD